MRLSGAGYSPLIGPSWQPPAIGSRKNAADLVRCEPRRGLIYLRGDSSAVSVISNGFSDLVASRTNWPTLFSSARPSITYRQRPRPWRPEVVPASASQAGRRGLDPPPLLGPRRKGVKKNTAPVAVENIFS